MSSLRKQGSGLAGGMDSRLRWNERTRRVRGRQKDGDSRLRVDDELGIYFTGVYTILLREGNGKLRIFASVIE